MTRGTSIKKQLAITTALVSAFFGYARRAYAECYSVGTPNYLCNNTTPTSTTQYISHYNAQVVLDPAFTMTTGGSDDGIHVTGDGSLSLTGGGTLTVGGTAILVQADDDFGGGAFAGRGPDPAQNKYTLGAQLRYFSLDGMELTGAYNFDIKSGYNAHTGFLRAGWKF